MKLYINTQKQHADGLLQ